MAEKMIKITLPDGRESIIPSSNRGFYERQNKATKDESKHVKIEDCVEDESTHVEAAGTNNKPNEANLLKDEQTAHTETKASLTLAIARSTELENLLKDEQGAHKVVQANLANEQALHAKTKELLQKAEIDLAGLKEQMANAGAAENQTPEKPTKK